MKSFPNNLIPAEASTFRKIWRAKMMRKLREEIYLMMISRKTFNEYYALDGFSKRNKLEMSMVQKMVKLIIPKLKKLGWKCQLSFGDTGLFIYGEEKPTNLWDEE